ncbi:hypothetical protein RISK_004579 [Rhodopirellula islandica]|uniref:Polysaccharide lyase 14 domain-containing protein n=1 Tax=Rhodopirellula islandica TaxID=595434 RepID=A0A0J1B969_RHOIS|nr:hypothetical protein RISK_004579 [Rhodopirellula islandica]
MHANHHSETALKLATLCFVCMTAAIDQGGELRADQPQTNESKSVSVGGAIILSNDFSDESIGPYTDVTFKADRDWGKVLWANYHGRAEIIDHHGDHQLRLKFPKGKFGHQHTGGNAAVSIGTHDEICQRVTIRFEPGFSFVKTGKIVGLGSGAHWSGGNVPREGQGYTSRFIWDREQEAAMYLYHMDQRSKYGDVVKLGFKFQTGVDYTLTQRVKTNTGSDPNGILQVWASENGEPPRLVVDRSDLRFGTKGRGKTESMFVAPFHGGGDSSFAAAETSYLTLDDFIISTVKFSDLP